MIDIAIVDGSSSKSLGREIAKVFKSLGLRTKVASPSWYLHSRKGRARLEQSFPCWIICWSHAVQGNAPLLDYAAVAAVSGFTDPWRPRLGPIICTKSKVEVPKVLKNARTIDLEPWYLGADKPEAKRAVRKLVDAAAQSLALPAATNYFDALVSSDADRIRAVAKFYYQNRDAGQASGPARKDWRHHVRKLMFWRDPPAIIAPPLSRLVAAALERCRKVSRTSEPLIANVPAQETFSFLMQHAHDTTNAVVPLQALPGAGDNDAKLRACLDVGLALNEQLSVSRTPPLLAYIYPENKDAADFGSPLGLLLREHVKRTDASYDDLETAHLKGESLTTLIQAFENRLAPLRIECAQFAHRTGIDGDPTTVKGLRQALFDPKPDAKMREPKWLFGVSSLQRRLRRWSNKAVNWLDEVFDGLRRAGVPKDGFYWVLGNWHSIAISGAALFGLVFTFGPSGGEANAETAARARVPLSTELPRAVERSSQPIGRVHRMVASHNSRQLAIVTAATITLIDTNDASTICALPAANYTSVAFSRDDAQLVTGALDGTVALWQTSDCGGVASIVAPNAEVMARVARGGRSEAIIDDVAFSQTGAILAAGHDNLIHVLALSPDRKLEESHTILLPSNPSRLMADNNGNVYVSLARGEVLRWMRGGGQPQVYLRSEGRVLLLRQSPVDGEVVVGQSGGSIEVVREGALRVHRSLRSPEVFATMDLAPNGLWFAAASRSGQIQLFDATSLELVTAQNYIDPAAHSCIGGVGENAECPLTALAIVEADDGQSARIFTAGDDGKLVVWHVATPSNTPIAAPALGIWEQARRFVFRRNSVQ